MQKYTKTLKNNTKIYSNNGYYDFVACNINGVTYVTCENIKIVLNQINLKIQISILCFIDNTVICSVQTWKWSLSNLVFLIWI